MSWLQRAAVGSARCFLAAVVAAALVAALVGTLDVRVTDSGWRTGVVLVATLGAALTGALLAWAGRRRPVLAAEAAVVAAAALLAGLGVAALDGTRWGWYGLFADSAFRSQMATRYADHLGLVDYGYRGLAAYYPPAVGWLQGRVADLMGVPGWQAVKPVQIAIGALVPLLAYALWRRVVSAPVAAAVAVVTATWCAHPQKPDEWLVLTCLVPWWLVAVRDVRAPGVPRPRAWALGVALGLLLLTHTYYFLPMGVATVLALAVDLVTRRRHGFARLPLGRAVGIGTVGLLVSSPYWVGAVLTRLRLPSDDLQLRYSYLGGNVPNLPAPPWEPIGAVALFGLLWLAGAAWRGMRSPDPLAGGLALALGGALLAMGAGALLERFDVGLLTFKTADLIEVLLVTCAVVGGARLLDRLRRVASTRRAWVATAIAVAGVAAAAAHDVASDWATGRPALVAQTTRYPDGSLPVGGRGTDPPVPVRFVAPDDPSVAELLAAWDRLRPGQERSDTVLVTSRVDLLATTPVFWFTPFKSIYSHPNGQFTARLDLLGDVARCDSPRCAATLLRDNPYDEVDGLMLERSEDGLALRFTVDDFPNRTRTDAVVFPEDLFAAPWFERTDVARWAVVAVR